MGFDTMGSFQRLMLATHVHEQTDSVGCDLDLGESDSPIHVVDAQFRDDNLHKVSRDAYNDSMAAYVKSRPVPVSIPSFRQATSSWSPPLSPRSQSPGTSPSLTTSGSATSLTDLVPPTPISAKEKNALANKLYAAACAGDLDTVRLLLSIGVPVDASSLVPGLFDSFKPAKPGHLSVLAGAASCGQMDAVRLLIANGALVNPNCCQSASSPLHQALRNNDMQIVQYLLDNGADIDISNSYNATPIMYAVKYSDPKLVALILSYQPDLNKLSFVGAAALHWSIWPCFPKSTELLLRAGADPNMSMLDGNSALHCAALSGSIQTVTSLLRYGANPHVRNADNQTPFDTATEAGSEDIARLLQTAMVRR